MICRSPVVLTKPASSDKSDPELAEIDQLFSSGALNPPAFDGICATASSGSAHGKLAAAVAAVRMNTGFCYRVNPVDRMGDTAGRPG
ncbi:MAG TPA: hypothetical protein VIY66_02780 [Candidatus Acidoferrales bacterium]